MRIRQSIKLCYYMSKWGLPKPECHWRGYKTLGL